MATQMPPIRLVTTVESLETPVPARRLMIPREHGAWAMLLLPFLSALVLTWELDWEVIPAAIAVVGLFLIREPLVALFRGREAKAALYSLAWYLSLILACGGVLLWRLPFWPLCALGLAAALLTSVSTYLAVHNRQRSVVLQLSSAAGLSASALIGWLAVRQRLDSEAWWLWALQFGHSAASLLVVRARLEARIAARRPGEPATMRTLAVVAQAALASGAVACTVLHRLGPAIALALSAGVHSTDLVRLEKPVSRQIPLRRGGASRADPIHRLLGVRGCGLVVIRPWPGGNHPVWGRHRQPSFPGCSRQLR